MAVAVGAGAGTFAAVAASRHDPMGEYSAPAGGIDLLRIMPIWATWFALAFTTVLATGLAWRVVGRMLRSRSAE